MLTREAETEHLVTALRTAIDSLDHAIIKLVADRRALVEKLFETKERAGLALVDPTREAELMSERQAFAATLGLPDVLVAQLFGAILAQGHADAGGRAAR